MQLVALATADSRCTERRADVEERQLRDLRAKLWYDHSDPHQPSFREAAKRDPTRIGTTTKEMNGVSADDLQKATLASLGMAFAEIVPIVRVENQLRAVAVSPLANRRWLTGQSTAGPHTYAVMNTPGDVVAADGEDGRSLDDAEHNTGCDAERRASPYPAHRRTPRVGQKSSSFSRRQGGDGCILFVQLAVEAMPDAAG